MKYKTHQLIKIHITRRLIDTTNNDGHEKPLLSKIHVRDFQITRRHNALTYEFYDNTTTTDIYLLSSKAYNKGHSVLLPIVRALLNIGKTTTIDVSENTHVNDGVKNAV